MSHSTPASVVSGKVYAVVSVAGGICEHVTDFLNDIEFTIDADEPYTVRGCGSLDGGEVRFYEKDHDGGGRDIRVWRIKRTRNGTFTAEHAVSV